MWGECMVGRFVVVEGSGVVVVWVWMVVVGCLRSVVFDMMMKFLGCEFGLRGVLMCCVNDWWSWEVSRGWMFGDVDFVDCEWLG